MTDNMNQESDLREILWHRVHAAITENRIKEMTAVNIQKLMMRCKRDIEEGCEGRNMIRIKAARRLKDRFEQGVEKLRKI